MAQQRVLSGMRPTGKLHWGNYFGALQNWVELQKEFDCFFFVADWHALTTSYDRLEEIAPAIQECLIDWLACGIDPKQSTLFLQSWVPEHAELHLLLSMMTPKSWLERTPSYKEMQQELPDRDLTTYGFLGYPLLQTADIVLYKAHFVPVGEDQLAHLELSREVVRRFHHLTNTTGILVEPAPKLTATPRIPGMDGRKMSKSFDNAIYIADDEETMRSKMMQTITDPARKRRSDPGNPEVCNIFSYHKLYTPKEKIAWIDQQCRAAGIGCVDCKKICIENAETFWKPIRKKRKNLAEKGSVLDLLRKGSDRARDVAASTMKEVRSALRINV